MAKDILCKSCYSANPIGLTRCQACRSPLQSSRQILKPEVKKMLMVMIAIDVLIGVAAVFFLLNRN